MYVGTGLRVNPNRPTCKKGEVYTCGGRADITSAKVNEECIWVIELGDTIGFRCRAFRPITERRDAVSGLVSSFVEVTETIDEPIEQPQTA